MEQAITLPSLLEKLRQGGYEDLKEVKEASVYDLTQGNLRVFQSTQESNELHDRASIE